MKYYIAIINWIVCSLFWGCQPPPPAVIEHKTDLVSWDFENFSLGNLPDSWLAEQTPADSIPASRWQVVGDSWGKAVGLTATTNTGNTFNLLFALKTRFGNVRVSAKVKAVSGKEDQGGGIVWRALNANNYYIVRWNPLENNLRLYYVQDGKRTMLRSVDIQANPDSWHTIEVEHFRENIKITMDGTVMIQQVDNTFALPGMIGLWTKADACAMFDDVAVETIF